MSKESAVTFRMEPELRDSFYAAVELEHRPAAQVLRELMRGYVEQARARATPCISPAERQRRQEAFDYATASVGLEGLRASEAFDREAERFIRGEMDLPTLGAKLRAITRQRVLANGDAD